MRLLVLAAVLGCSSSTATKPAPSGGSPFERFATMTPKVGELAPDFDLIAADGGHVKLSDAVARGPVVLVWGSFS